MMDDLFYERINQIEKSDNPIVLAWDYAIEHLGLESEFCHEFLTELKTHVGKMSNKNAYHNEQHFGHVMLCSTYLLDCEFENTEEKKMHFFPLLLSAMFHDIGHPGRPNQFDFELEYESVKTMVGFIEEHKLDDCWDKEKHRHQETWKWQNWNEMSRVVKELILSTEFKAQAKTVAKSYEDHPDEVWSMHYPIKINRLKMLLTESDILLSCLAKTGWNQSIKMFIEGGHTFDNQKTIIGWSGFLELTKNHYKSHAAYFLDIPLEIEKLKEDLQKISQNETLLSNPMGYLMKTSKNSFKM